MAALLSAEDVKFSSPEREGGGRGVASSPIRVLLASASGRFPMFFCASETNRNEAQNWGLVKKGASSATILHI